MKKLIFNKLEITHEYDVKTLCAQLKEAGYEASKYDVHCAWSAFSYSMCASWMSLYDAPSDNVTMLLSYLEGE